MTLLQRVTGLLVAEGIPQALIGAAALAVHGVSRSTLDLDLMVVDERVLDATFWSSLQQGVSVDARRGDVNDPLAGVVCISHKGERDVDVVVGRDLWQEDILGRAIKVGDHGLRVVEAADLILTKLYAGGSQDRWDIEQLLAVDEGAATPALVDSRASVLPARSLELWASLRPRN